MSQATILRRGGIAAAAAVIAIIIGGCLQFPLGDPETSKIDSTLNGVWFKRGEGGEVVLWSVQPFDSRCYLLINYSARPDGGGGWERGEMSICKGWLTEVNGRQFLTMKMMVDVPEETPYIVAKIERSGETLTALGVKPDFVKENKIDSAEAFAKLVADNVDNAKMYLDADKFEKAGDADADTVKTILQAFH
jgi:hypothetical protein